MAELAAASVWLYYVVALKWLFAFGLAVSTISFVIMCLALLFIKATKIRVT